MADPVPLARVRDLLVEEAERRTLPREATLAKEHAEQFGRLPSAKAEELVGKLRELGFVEPVLAVKIADVLPQYPEEVRLLYAKERTTVDEAQIARILETVADYR